MKAQIGDVWLQKLEFYFNIWNCNFENVQFHQLGRLARPVILRMGGWHLRKWARHHWTNCFLHRPGGRATARVFWTWRTQLPKSDPSTPNALMKRPFSLSVTCHADSIAFMLHQTGGNSFCCVLIKPDPIFKTKRSSEARLLVLVSLSFSHDWNSKGLVAERCWN